MASFFSTSAARNMFYGGTLFSVLLFLGVTLHTESVLPQRDQRAQIATNPAIAAGKRI